MNSLFLQKENGGLQCHLNRQWFKKGKRYIAKMKAIAQSRWDKLNQLSYTKIMWDIWAVDMVIFLFKTLPPPDLKSLLQSGPLIN